jgi:pyruvate dehydrogenase E1 component alpha subunit
MNMAGVWRAPVVFVINNNQWAISAPRSIQTAARTLAQKAIAAGIEGHQVDGNDVIAVRHVIQEAVEKARTGGGPTLIEAISYRLGDHTTTDDATRYRDPELVRQHWALEPIARLRNYLVRAKVWDKDQEDRLLKECSEAINHAVDDYLAVPAPSTEAMFDHLYAMLPDTMREQRATALRFAPTKGERHR